MKHTQGPWMFKQHKTDAGSIIYSEIFASDKVIFSTLSREFDDPRETADVHLASVAPEMREGLVEAVDFIEQWMRTESDGLLVEKLKALIKKAGGS